MEETREQRAEQRLYYNWPVRFTDNLGGAIFEGRMSDVSSQGGAFTCEADENCPYPGQQITTLFSVPRFDSGMVNLIRIGRVYRVNNVNRFIRRVAVQFAEPLPFKPIEVVSREFAATS